MNPRIHQLTAGATPGDAITNYAFDIQALFAEAGINTHIFTPRENTSPELGPDKIRPLEDFSKETSPGDLIFYHYSTGTEATNCYLQKDYKRLLYYHNITPAMYFRSVSQERAKQMDMGRENLKKLADKTDLAVAASHYSAKELESYHFPGNEVVPITLSRDYLDTEPHPDVLRRFQNTDTHLLFVGRMVPNKRFEDLIETFRYYHHTCNPQSRLHLVGSYIDLEHYFRYLKTFTHHSGLVVGQDVFFHGHVSLAELIGFYHISDAFVCLSEHEGFGVPLIEAIHFNIPVFALDRAAVKETLGGAGVLLNDWNPQATAELLHLVLNQPEMCKSICLRQRERLDAFDRPWLKKHLFNLLDTYFGFKLAS